MAKTQFRRIITEDFDKEMQPTIAKLAYIINDAFEIFTYSLGKGITIQDNLNQELIDLSITVDATGKPKLATQIKHSLKTSIKGIQVIYAQNQKNLNTYPTNQPFVSFNTISSNLLEIKNISGLQADQKYLIRLLLIGG